MKRIRLTLSILVASVLSCMAMGSTAATATPQSEGVSTCSMLYLYCIAVGNDQAYCWTQYVACCDAGGCQNTAVASKQVSPGD